MAFEFHPIGSLKTLFGYGVERPPQRTVTSTDALRLIESGASYYFKKQMEISGERLGIYKDVEEMDQDDIVTAALDLIAEDATQMDLRTNKSLWVESGNPDIKKLIDDFLDTIEMEGLIFSLTREVAKYGDSFSLLMQEKNEDGTPGKIVGLKWMDPKSIHRHTDKFNRLKGFSIGNQPDKQNISAPWEYIHYRLLGRDRGTEYGTSYLASCRRMYRRLRMMEDSLVIYRIKRAPDRLIFSIKGLEELSPEDRVQAFNEIRKKLRKKMLVDPVTGSVRSEVDPMSVDEDYFIDESAVALTKMAGSNSVGQVFDIDYIRKRFFGCLKIPPDYLGFSDAKGGLLAQTPLSHQDVQFARQVKRLQRAVVVGTVRLIQIHLSWMKIDPLIEKNDFTVRMVPASFLDELQWGQVLELKAKILAILTDIGTALNIDKDKFTDYLIQLSDLPKDIVGEFVSTEDVSITGDVDLTEEEEVARVKELAERVTKLEKYKKAVGQFDPKRRGGKNVFDTSLKSTQLLPKFQALPFPGRKKKGVANSNASRKR